MRPRFPRTADFPRTVIPNILPRIPSSAVGPNILSRGESLVIRDIYNPGTRRVRILYLYFRYGDRRFRCVPWATTTYGLQDLIQVSLRRDRTDHRPNIPWCCFPDIAFNRVEGFRPEGLWKTFEIVILICSFQPLLRPMDRILTRGLMTHRTPRLL